MAVPMAQNAKEEARMCGLARACLTTFPVQVKQALSSRVETRVGRADVG